MNHSFDAESPGRAFANAMRAPLPIAMAATLILALLLGGSPMRMGLPLAVIAAAGIVVLALAIREGALSDWRRMPLLARIGTAGAALLPLLQLIPLPADVWQALPGRALERSVLALVGLAGSARPVSIAPADTAIALMMVFPVAGMLLGGLAVRRKQARALIWVLAALVALSFALGALQVASAGTLRVHDTPHNGFLLGFFTNKNHSALLMAAGILIGNDLVTRYLTHGDAIVAARIGTLVLGFAAILATGSRFGLILGVAAGAVVLVDIARGWGGARKIIVLLVAALAAVAALLTVMYSGTASRSIARYGDLGDDTRMIIWTNSMAAAREYFPVGTGMGTFVDVYRTVEPVASLSPTYANHAHNEYIELAIEGGAAALLLLAALVVAWAWRWWTVARMRPATHQLREERAIALLGAAILVLPLLHSLVDYPARTAALAMLFAMSFGWLMRPSLSGGREPAPSSHHHA